MLFKISAGRGRPFAGMALVVAGVLTVYAGSFLRQAFVAGPKLRSDRGERLSTLGRHYGATSIADPPAPPETEEDSGRRARFAQCFVQYSDLNGRPKGESWVFHMEAAEENSALAEKKPSFPRLLKKNAYIWGRNTTVKCSPYESVPDLGGPCVECVRLFVGGLYGGGVIVPAFDPKNPKQSSWTAEQCMDLKKHQPPSDDVAADYAETAGGGAPGHEPRMSPFCRSALWGGLWD